MSSKPNRVQLAALAAGLALVAATALPAATVQIINADGPGVGMNDTTPVAPVGGNPGTTRGAQRLNVLLRAAEIWASQLDSAVPIVIRATSQNLTCTPTSAVLASAGTAQIFRDFPNAPLAGTFYHSALANSLAGVDLDPATHDITTQYNLSIDTGGAGCLGGVGWYYGYDHNEGAQVDLLATMLHEYGHGYGFANFVNETDGTQAGGFPDIYSEFTFDLETMKGWNEMTNAERVASAINDPDVVWTGPEIAIYAPRRLNKAARLLINTAPIIGNHPAQPAAFGPAVPSPAGITGTVVQMLDTGGTAVSTTDGCDTITNGGAVSGNIALVDRGNCNFTVKVANAQAAGATAVLVANNAAGLPPMGGTDPSITISSYGIEQAVGASIVANSPGVGVTLGFDPVEFAGTTQGMLRVNAPNPVAPGSSISHWTPAAEPSLLMEPAITSALTDDVDLTLDLFDDIGWQWIGFDDGVDTGDCDAWDGVEPAGGC